MLPATREKLKVDEYYNKEKGISGLNYQNYLNLMSLMEMDEKVLVLTTIEKTLKFSQKPGQTDIGKIYNEIISNES
jgi:hypothetical protein